MPCDFLPLFPLFAIVRFQLPGNLLTRFPLAFVSHKRILYGSNMIVAKTSQKGTPKSGLY